MSFKCENCNAQQERHVNPIMTVAKKRKRYYPEVRNQDNEIVESAGHGWEIVKEKACCAKCAPKVDAYCR